MKCRSCEASIYWVFTEHGKRMPIDADPSAAGNVVLTVRLGGRIAVVLPPESLFEDEAITELRQQARYTSHFVTCPHADEWRSKTGGR
jgi:hypothetical protein